MRLAAVLAAAAVLCSAAAFDDRMKAGLAALERGDDTRAELELRKAAALAPDNAHAHAALALALIAGKQRPEALAEYKKALRLDRRYVEGLKVGKSLRKWSRPPEIWDLEQQNLALEVLNEPKAHEKTALKPNIHFPPDWVVDENTARPDAVGTAASITVSGGKDVFDAIDAADWLEHAIKASPERYRGFKMKERHAAGRQGETVIKAIYSRKAPRYRERFVVMDLVLLKNGEFRRAIYEAPESEYEVHAAVAERSLDTLHF